MLKTTRQEKSAVAELSDIFPKLTYDSILSEIRSRITRINKIRFN